MKMEKQAAKHQDFRDHQGLSVDTDNHKPVTAETILTLLLKLGLRNTRTRRLIAERLATFAVSRSDFTVQELWQDLREIAPVIGRVTVYRTVELLVSQGLIQCVSFASGCYRYRLDSGSHRYQIICTQCQRVTKVSMCLPPEVITTIEAMTDFMFEGYSLELFGRCASCRGNTAR